jgi:hypothetical protein
MDSILTVCYSYTGTSRRAAQLLCSHHGWPLGEVADTEPRGLLRCVLDSLLRRRPHIVYRGPDPGDFRTVVLVGPIWVSRLAGPMRSFVADHREQLGRVALVFTHGGGGAASASAEAKHLLGHAPIAAAAFLKREIEDGSGTNRLLDFGDALQPGSAAVQPVMPASILPAS